MYETFNYRIDELYIQKVACMASGVYFTSMSRKADSTGFMIYSTLIGEE